MKRIAQIIIIILLVACDNTLHSQDDSGARAGVVFNSLRDSSRYTIKPLSINSASSEYAPRFNDSSIFFVSDRRAHSAFLYAGVNGERFSDVYVATGTDSINFTNARRFASRINSVFNDGPIWISTDGDSVIYSANDKDMLSLFRDEYKMKSSLQLYCSVKKGKRWSKGKRLTFCDTSANYTHPFFDYELHKLFFVSDRAGGAGGMDLYAVELNGSSWGVPINLPLGINSRYDELFPFVAGGVIHFSSNRSETLGGLDLFSCSLSTSDPMVVQHPAAPLNSPYDDFGMIANSTITSGYFCSNRDSFNDNIYYFKNKYPDFNNCTDCVDPTYCYTFFEEGTVISEDTLTLMYEWNMGDSTKIKGMEAHHCFEKPGTYQIELNIVEKESGILFYNETTYEFTVEDASGLYFYCDDTATTMDTIRFDCEQAADHDFTPIAYYWSFGDGYYSTGAQVEHYYDRPGEYFVQLTAFVDRDSTGFKEYICKSRTVSIVPPQNKFRKNSDTSEVYDLHSDNHTTTSGIDSVKFRVHLGTSSVHLDTSIALFNGLDTIREVKSGGLYQYTSGSYTHIVAALPNFNKARNSGFNSPVVVAFLNDSMISENVKLSYIIPDTKPNTKVALEPESTDSNVVYFAFDKYGVSSAYYKTLDSIVVVLNQNPGLAILLRGYTDTTGSATYNQTLAAKRCDSVRKYFISKGVEPEKIKTITIGELNTNQPMTAPLRRRVSIIIH